MVCPLATSAATHRPTTQSMHAAPTAEILPASQTMHVLVAVPTAADFPAAQLVQAAPLVEILPATQFVQSVSIVLPGAAVEVPATQYVQPTVAVCPLVTSAATHRPTTQSTHAAPTAEILPASQTMQVLVAVPTAADFPAAQFVQPAPSNETFPTGHATQSVTLVPAPAVTEVPAAHFVHSVAPVVASLAGASAYVPAAQFSHAAATEASALNFPPLQLLHVLAPAPTPPIDDVPAAHVVHGPVAAEDVPAVLNSPTAHGLQVVVVVPVAAVPPVAVVALPVGQLRQAEDSVEWS